MLKFFGTPWLEEHPVLPSSNEDAEDDQAVAEVRRVRAKQASRVQLASARKAEGDDPNRWEKEIQVFFDDSKPVGLGFQPASTSGNDAFQLVPAEKYACEVKDVAPAGLATDYNARCRAAGDYSRVIVEKLRVRMVNRQDVANVPYTEVLKMMREAKPSLALTLADVSSGLANAAFETREKKQSTLVHGRPSRRSSLSVGPGKLGSRHDSHVVALKRESVQLPETTESHVALGGVDGDLQTKYVDASQQLSSAIEQINALQREREEVVTKEREVAALQLEAFLQESRKVQRERDDMIAVNKLLLRHKRASATTKAELEAAKAEQMQMQGHQEELERTLRDVQSQLVEQTQATLDSQEQANQLRHDKEMLSLQWQELQEEHQDTQSHVDELHDRLVDAQRAHRALEVVLAALRTSHAAKMQQVRELQDALQAVNARMEAAQPEQQLRSSIDVAVETESALQVQLLSRVTATASTLSLLEKLKDVDFDIAQHRDELLAEFSCHEQKLQQLQEQVQALELVNSTSKQLLASLHEELREAQNRERSMRSEFSAELEVVRKNVEQEAQTAQNNLKNQIRELEQRCAEERADKIRLLQELDQLKGATSDRAALQARDQEFLVQFKRQMENGIVVTKFGARGVPHQRVVYSDAHCHWLSWRSPATSTTNGALIHPKADSKVDTCDLVEVLAGASTETFARQRPEAPSRCFSLVFVHPCRTLDLQADTAAQCQQYLRGFRLLQEEAVLKRR